MLVDQQTCRHTVKIDYYYKHKKTSELVLVTGFGAGWTNYYWTERVFFKDPVTDYVMREDLVDFIFQYQEYNP